MTNIYEGLLDNAPAPTLPPGAANDPYAGLLDKNQASQINVNLNKYAGQNADKAATQQADAAWLGIPYETAQNPAVEKDISKQVAIQKLDVPDVVTNFPYTASRLADPQKAALIHDNIEPMAALESAVKSFTMPTADQVYEDLKNVPYEGLKGLGGSFNSIEQAAATLVGGLPIGEDAKDWFANNITQPLLERGGAFQPDQSAGPLATTANAVGGVLGLISQVVATGGAGDATAAATIPEYLAGAAETALKGMALPATTAFVNTMRDVYQATGDFHTALQAGYRAYVTNTVYGIAPLNVPGGLFKRMLTGAALFPLTSEEGRRIQNYGLPPELQTQFDVKNIGTQALTGALLAGVVGPRSEGGLNVYVRKTYLDAANAEQSTRDLQALNTIDQISNSVKLRDRNANEFKQFVQDAADGPVKQVFIDAHDFDAALKQSGVDSKTLFETLPALQTEISNALDRNGQVAIPIEDYATNIAGTKLGEAMKPDLRVQPDGMSLGERDEFIKGETERMQQAAQDVLKKKAADDAWIQSSNEVYKNVRSQLDQASNYTPQEKNAFAAIHRDFYTTLADSLNITPQEAFDKYGFKLQTEGLQPSTAVGQTAPDVTRGFYDPDSATIGLLKAANVSTFLHESGHLFLDNYARIAGSENAPEGVKADMDRILKWFGVDSLDKWNGMSLDEQRPYHEQLAKGFERYLMEGKAPTLELQPLFSKIRNWLTRVYQSVTDLGVPMNDDVRGVFDRMLGSQEAIAEARRARGYFELSEKPTGMSDEDWQTYKALGQQSTDDAEQTLQARSLRTMGWIARAKDKFMSMFNKDVQAKRDTIQEQVQKEIEQQPIYQADRFIRTGETAGEDGETIQAAAGHKIDESALRKLYDGMTKDEQDALIKQLGKGKSGRVGDKGLDPNLLAEMYGFSDGKDLVNALLNSPKPEDAVREATDARMVATHGDLSTPEAAREAADEAIHNEARLRFTAASVKALGKLTGSVRDIMRAAKDYAARMIGQTKIKDINPNRYGADEMRANRASQKLMAKGKLKEAAAEQRNVLLNNAATKRAYEAQTEITKSLKYLNRFGKEATRDKIANEFLGQIDALLDRFDLRKSPPTEQIKQRQDLADWVNKMAGLGELPNISKDILNDALRKPYKELTFDEFNGLVDAIKSIENIGRRALEADVEGKKVALAELGKQMREQAETLPQNPAQTNRGKTRMESKLGDMKAGGRSYLASHIKAETMIDAMDNFNPNGLFNRVLWRPFELAQKKANEMKEVLKTNLEKAISAFKNVKPQGDKIYVADKLIDSETGEAQKLTHDELLGMAANVGNDSNFEKMVTAEKWNPKDVMDFLNKNLTKQDWDMVQAVWDSFEPIWKEKTDMYKRRGEELPAKIEPKPVETPHGTYRGGYYPIIHDGERSADVRERNARTGDEMLENIYKRANTDTGRMKNRVDNYFRPLLFSLKAGPRVALDEIHDVTHREAIINAVKILRQKDVRQAIKNTLSQDHYDQLGGWLQGIANDSYTDLNQLSSFAKAANWIRTRSITNAIAFRISTILKHGSTAWFHSATEIGPKWLMKGMAEMYNPVTFKDRLAFVIDRSREIPYRLQNMDRDLRDQYRAIELHDMDATTRGYIKLRDWALINGNRGVAMSDLFSSLPTWLGAYSKAYTPESKDGLGFNEQDAIFYADKMVRNSHGAGGAKDLAAVQRGNEQFKLLTQLYSFWNHTINRQAALARAVKMRLQGAPTPVKGANLDVMSILLKTLALTAATGLTHRIGQHRKDTGEENYFADAADLVASSIANGFVGIRDIYPYLTGESEYRDTPLVGMTEDAKRLLDDAVNKLKDKDVSAKWLRHGLTVAGYMTGLPVGGQVAATSQFLWDVVHGDQDPKTVADWWNGVLHGNMSVH